MTSWLSFRCPSSLHSNLQMSLRQVFSLLHTDFIPPSFQVHHGFSATVELTFSFHHHFSPLRCFFVELQNLIAASWIADIFWFQIASVDITIFWRVYHSNCCWEAFQIWLFQMFNVTSRCKALGRPFLC